MLRLGQLLYRQRAKKRLSLEDIEKAIKIKASFLSAIEKGDYNKLPSPAYAKGFVINYASYLGISKAEATALFRREFDEKRAYKVLPDAFTKTRTTIFRGIKIQESLLVVGFIIILFLGFIFFQYRSAFFAPSLTISSPKQEATLSKDIMVSGKTDSDATVTVNNQQVSLNSDGAFSKHLTLFPGNNTISIKAVNRFGKATVVEREVVIK